MELTEGFWLGQTETTQSQWTQLMGTSPWRGKSNVREGKNYAASFISWEDASSFVEQLNSKEHGSGSLPNDWEYSLPREAQWEYACRGGKKSAFSFGDDPSDFQVYGWSAENAFEKGKRIVTRWARNSPMNLAYTICTAMFGSGAKTVLVPSFPAVQTQS